MIRAAVCIAFVACIAQVHCGSYYGGSGGGGGDAVIRVVGGHSGGTISGGGGGGAARVRILDGGSGFFSGGGRSNVINVGGTVGSAPVRVNCPAHGPQRIHVRAGHQGRPNVRVIRPSNPEPVTVNCPNHAGQNIVVQGAPAPRPIITVDRHGGSGFGGGFVSGGGQGFGSGFATGFIRSTGMGGGFIDVDEDSGSFSAEQITVRGGSHGGYVPAY